MLIIKIIQALWPFIKEMVLGDKTVAQVVKNNKSKLLFILLIFSSISLNVFAVPRMVAMAKTYLELVQKHKETEANLVKAQDQIRLLEATQKQKPKKDNPEEVPEIVVKHPKPPVKAKPTKLESDLAAKRADALKEHFDKIKKREEIINQPN
jgi:type II secretory pathway component PulC